MSISALSTNFFLALSRAQASSLLQLEHKLDICIGLLWLAGRPASEGYLGGLVGAVAQDDVHLALASGFLDEPLLALEAG